MVMESLNGKMGKVIKVAGKMEFLMEKGFLSLKLEAIIMENSNLG